jgi:hypothetical protein
MNHLSRYVGSLLLSVALVSPLVSTGCAGHAYVRVYDPYYHDYHRWDHGEDVYYNQWTVETHHDRVDYNHLSKEDQHHYWDWRHHHGDNH